MSVYDSIFDSWYEHLMECEQCAAGEVSDVERCEKGRGLAARVIAASKNDEDAGV